MDEALEQRLNAQDEVLKHLAEATMDLANKLFWLYNACDFLDREDAMAMIEMFNREFMLVEDLTLIDPEEFDALTPDMFNDPDAD